MISQVPSPDSTPASEAADLAASPEVTGTGAPSTPPSPARPAGSEGLRPFRERLWPGIGSLAGFGVFVVGAMIAFIPLGPIPAFIAAVLLVIGAVAAVIAASPTVELDPSTRTLRAGRAVVPTDAIASMRPVTATDLRFALGRDLDPKAYLCVRGWITSAVRVELNDPLDPTPYWLVSCRHPERLIQAHSRYTA